MSHSRRQARGPRHRRPIHRFAWLACLVACLATQRPALADDWAAPVVTEVFSESRNWFVRVVPGRSLGDSVGFAGSPKGSYAKAEWYRVGDDRSYRFVQEATLVNPVAPVKFLVTDRGYLVTLDNWHNMGYGKVVVSRGPDGRAIAAFELEDLFAPAEVAAFETSVSSIWWRHEAAYIRDGQQSVHVALNESGAALIYEAETGAWQVCDWQGTDYLCRSPNSRTEWRPYVEPVLRR